MTFEVGMHRMHQSKGLRQAYPAGWVACQMCSPDADVAEVLVEMSPTKFGYDYTFDCTGNVDVMRACLEAETHAQA